MSRVKYCRQVKEDVIPCGSPPLRGENYCHFHLRYKRYPLRTWGNQLRLGGLRLTRGMALNLKATEANLKRVERLLASGTCSDPKRARTIRWGLQTIVADLRRMQEEREIRELVLGGQRRLGPP